MLPTNLALKSHHTYVLSEHDGKRRKILTNTSVLDTGAKLSKWGTNIVLSFCVQMYAVGECTALGRYMYASKFVHTALAAELP